MTFQFEGLVEYTAPACTFTQAGIWQCTRVFCSGAITSNGVQAASGIFIAGGLGYHGSVSHAQPR